MDFYTISLRLENFGIKLIMKDQTKDVWGQVIREYDRLVAEKRAQSPLEAHFLPKRYYARVISTNPEFGYTENYVYYIIKQRHALKC